MLLKNVVHDTFHRCKRVMLSLRFAVVEACGIVHHIPTVCVVSVCCCFFLPACVGMCEPERLTFFCNFTVDYTWLARERRAVC